MHRDAGLVVGGAAAVEPPVPLGRDERVAVPVGGSAGRLHVVVRVQQDVRGAGRARARAEHGGAAVPGGDHVDLGQAARAEQAATSPALAHTCGAASGSADTDGIRTSRSRSARADGSTCRTRSPISSSDARNRSDVTFRTLPA